MLVVTMITATTVTGLQQAKADDNDEKSRDQKNKCETTHKNSKVDCKNQLVEQNNNCKVFSGPQYKEQKLECNNLVAYGIVCLPGATCNIDPDQVPFELVTPL
jgi:hypothetical protein